MPTVRGRLSMSACRLLALAIICTVGVQSVQAGSPPRRVYKYRDAEKARRLARDECRPLVIHFVPDSKLGADQLKAFYAQSTGVPAELLEQVVIVVVPTERFRRFARQLGVTEAGGYRTISAFDLSTVDQESQPTYRSGFV